MLTAHCSLLTFPGEPPLRLRLRGVRLSGGSVSRVPSPPARPASGTSHPSRTRLRRAKCCLSSVLLIDSCPILEVINGFEIAEGNA
jgi:hypothetical protein